MTTKEILTSLIKEKGNCTQMSIDCNNNCPIDNECGNNSEPMSIDDLRYYLYQAAVQKYIEKYGKDELIGLLI